MESWRALPVGLSTDLMPASGQAAAGDLDTYSLNIRSVSHKLPLSSTGFSLDAISGQELAQPTFV